MAGEPKYLSAYETHGIPVDGGYFLDDLRSIASRVGVPEFCEMTKSELIHALNVRLPVSNGGE